MYRAFALCFPRLCIILGIICDGELGSLNLIEPQHCRYWLAMEMIGWWFTQDKPHHPAFLQLCRQELLKTPALALLEYISLSHTIPTLYRQFRQNVIALTTQSIKFGDNNSPPRQPTGGHNKVIHGSDGNALIMRWFSLRG